MNSRWQHSENCFEIGVQYTPENAVARVFLGWWTWIVAFRGPAPIGYKVISTDADAGGARP